MVVVNLKVSHAACAVHNGPHVAVVCREIVDGVNLGTGSGRNFARGRSLSQLEDLIIHELIYGGSPCAPDIDGLLLLDDLVNALGGVSGGPGADFLVELGVERTAGNARVRGGSGAHRVVSVKSGEVGGYGTGESYKSG